jgi:heme-degrading monooxygenase HmoA
LIVKFITCVVPPENRSLFATGQEAWAALAEVDGFIAQTGGWSCNDDSLAIILAFWEGAAAYEHFLRNIHDAIFESNGQEGSYTEITVSLFEEVFEMPGTCSSFRSSILSGNVVRIVDCRVEPDRVEHFHEVQQTVWKPGMGRADGMLGGVFSRGRDDRLRHLVTTLWESEEAHRHYRQGVFSSLRDRARPDEDCSSIDRALVRVEPSWRVVSV